MVILRPPYLKRSVVRSQYVLFDGMDRTPIFVIHPESSVLAQQLVLDSTALQDENYSGIYDESGDYIPQYCDNPDEIPQGALTPNPESTGNAPESPGGTPGPDGEPSNSDQGSPDELKR